MRIAPLCALCAATACGDGDPRPQLVVYVDTDLPLSGQLLDDDAYSFDAAVDTIRIDALIEEDGVLRSFDLRTLAVPDASSWPVTFGVAAGELDGALLLRMRLFRAQFAAAGETSGRKTLDPLPQVTVDRIVAVAPPSEGIERLSLTLSGDCMGTIADFGALRSCIDADNPSGTPDEGLAHGALVATKAGSWPWARFRDCAGEPPDGARCIPGGFFVLGDPRYVGISEDTIDESMPLRPVRLSPFYLDVFEFTVGRLERAVAGGYAGPLPQEPVAGDPARQFCTWHADGSGADDLPLNCVFQQAARQMCEHAGGTLPSEAQWEYAARGRGQRRLYPWGEQDPTCCTASQGRVGDPDVLVECDDGSGIEPVGSHPATEACGGIGDVSRDGILDMGGSVSEQLLDELLPLDAPCWSQGLLLDPVCQESALYFALRGSFWNAGLANAATPWRRAAIIGQTAGFRCAYAAEAAP